MIKERKRIQDIGTELLEPNWPSKSTKSCCEASWSWPNWKRGWCGAELEEIHDVVIKLDLPQRDEESDYDRKKREAQLEKLKAQVATMKEKLAQ